MCDASFLFRKTIPTALTPDRDVLMGLKTEGHQHRPFGFAQKSGRKSLVCSLCQETLFVASIGVLTDVGVRFGWVCEGCGYVLETGAPA